MHEKLEGRARRQATVLRDLHRPGDPLVLPNVWDCAGARRAAAAGFPVIATSSAAVAESLGHHDHEGMDPDRAFAAVGRITETVDCPVTADLESGYGLDPAEFIVRLLEVGAAGFNVEDTSHTTGAQVGVEAQSGRIQALRQAGEEVEFPVVINARIDTWLHVGDDRERALQDSVHRGQAYLAAGADCVFPIGCSGRATVADLVNRIAGPVNVLHGPEYPRGLSRLVQLGVARISTGPYLWRHVLEQIDRDLAALASIRSHPTPGDPLTTQRRP